MPIIENDPMRTMCEKVRSYACNSEIEFALYKNGFVGYVSRVEIYPINPIVDSVSGDAIYIGSLDSGDLNINSEDEYVLCSESGSVKEELFVIRFSSQNIPGERALFTMLSSCSQ